MQRDPKMKTLLQKLDEADRLFDYNVPARIRSGDDDRLYSYLCEVYAQSDFVVREPEEILKYAAGGDRVAKVGDFPGFVLVGKDQWGAVLEAKDNRAEVAFYDMHGAKGPSPEQWTQLRKLWKGDNANRVTVGTDRLIALGHFRTFAMPEIFYSMSQLSELPAEERRGTYVRYTGETAYRDPKVMDGAQGVILGKHVNNAETLYNIQWINGSGTRHKIREITNTYGILGYMPTICHRPREFSLIIKNDISFERLWSECNGTVQK